jgi:LacI family transcriptional regulator
VLQVIADLDYRPSALARALVSGSTKTLALLVSDIANPFYPQLAKSIEREASAQGYALVICNTGDNARMSAALVRGLIDQGVAGLIHASVGRDEDEVLSIVDDQRRIVFVNRRPRSQHVSYVVADNTEAGALLTRHLVDCGHRFIGFVGGPSWAANAQERREGFLTVVRTRGIEGLVADGDFSIKSGATAVRRWLASGTLPTAIVAVSDEVGIGVLSELGKRGRTAPFVAVGAFDDTDIAGFDLISLTSVAQHIRVMGERAVRLLLRQINGQSSPPLREVLKPELHVRRSSVSPADRESPAAPAGTARNSEPKTVR